MIRRFALLAVLLPAAAAHAQFDARAWLAEARASLTSDDFDVRAMQSRRLAEPLDAAVGWRRGCDTYADPETDELVYDPVDPDFENQAGRGMLEVLPMGEAGDLVSVMCYLGAYQPALVLVHFQGDDAHLVQTQLPDENDQPSGPPLATFGWIEVRPEAGTFTSFIKSRGIGGCGTFATYALGEGGDAEAVEVRARACDDFGDEDEEMDLDPRTWPVVFHR